MSVAITPPEWRMIAMWYRNPTRIAVVSLLGVLSMLLVAQSGAQMGQGQQAPGQPSALEREYVNLQQRLAQAQAKAVESNPALQDQMDAIEDLVTEKMRAAGYDTGSLMETLLAAQGMMQEPGISDAQRREILQSRELQEAQKTLDEAQQKVAQDPEVQAARNALEDDMMAAMRKVEPQADQMIERLQQIQAQIQGGRR
jgi:hypothetical protein